MEDRPSHRPRGAEVAVNMDLDAAKFWFQVAQTLITAALGVYVYISNRNRVTNERISSLERDMDTRIDGHTERLARVESRLTAVPTHDDMAKLADKINRVAEDTSRMSGELKGVNDTLRLILARITDRGLK